MALQTWVTRPPKPFDSFYFYDTDKLDFVRIRLELGRTGDNPDPGVFSRLHRYVGFVPPEEKFLFKELERWSVNAGKNILYRYNEFDNKVLPREPEAGKRVIDFSLPGGEAHPSFVHPGNQLVNNPYRLPKNSQGKDVTVEMLRSIALDMMGKEKSITLCSSNATPAVLGDALFALYHLSGPVTV